MKFSPFILYSGPGMMGGVRGAGSLMKVLHAHFHAEDQENRVLDSLKALYASSAGVPNALYFAVARNLEEGLAGARIYAEYLTGRNFINLWNIPASIVYSMRQWFHRALPSRENIPHVANIDYLIRIIREKVPLAVERLKDLPFDFYAFVLNRKTRGIETVHMNTASDPFQVLHDSITPVPYYHPPREQQHIDAAIGEGYQYRYLRERHPREKLVFVANSPSPHIERLSGRIRERLLLTFHGLLSIPYGIGPTMFLRCLQRMREEEEEIRGDSRALLICPGPEQYVPSHTTSRQTLQTLFREGEKDGERILAFLAS